MECLSRVWLRLKELFGKQTLNESKGMLLPAWKTVTGETPSVSFETLLAIYVSDPAARAAVDFLADQAVGAGFYTTTDLPEAKALVDGKCQELTRITDAVLKTLKTSNPNKKMTLESTILSISTKTLFMGHT